MKHLSVRWARLGMVHNFTRENKVKTGIETCIQNLRLKMTEVQVSCETVLSSSNEDHPPSTRSRLRSGMNHAPPGALSATTLRHWLRGSDGWQPVPLRMDEDMPCRLQEQQSARVPSPLVESDYTGRRTPAKSGASRVWTLPFQRLRASPADCRMICPVATPCDPEVTEIERLTL